MNDFASTYLVITNSDTNSEQKSEKEQTKIGKLKETRKSKSYTFL